MSVEEIWESLRRSLKVKRKTLTVDINESNTLTAKAVPQANGCVKYNSVSGSSSSS